MKTLISILIIAQCSLHAELIKGNATVVQSKTGLPVLTLYDSVFVQADHLYAGYYPIGLVCIVDAKDAIHPYTGESQVSQEITVKKGATLRSSDGKILGIALLNFPAQAFSIHTGKIEIGLYGLKVALKDIYASSDAETVLEKTLAKGKVNLADFTGLFRDLRYSSWIDSAGFRTYIKIGSDVISTPGTRLIVVFWENRLFAVLSASKLHLPDIFRLTSHGYLSVAFVSNQADVITKFQSIYFDMMNHAD